MNAQTYIVRSKQLASLPICCDYLIRWTLRHSSHESFSVFIRHICSFFSPSPFFPCRMNSKNFVKYKNGTGGAYTPEFHKLMGTTPWIQVKRLLVKTPAAPGGTEDRSAPSEGDVVTVFSQFGEVVDIRFVRHRTTGKILGAAFIQFADYRSGIAASDAMNSDSANGEEIYLSSAYEGGPGVAVERCEEQEVVTQALPAEDGYARWVQRQSELAAAVTRDS
ncbi:RNA-binding protein [Strigomonas culicis]|uniref:RNA-binding protein n=1 Tax=Strigomonas culicis TaxID=28005 RepID=S9UF52_9TRYP|nr:RNA-binding protein [Strigomonas culicis]|eukprot:EPY29442.1 RNA-binding protein [Strigomonas culicis]